MSDARELAVAVAMCAVGAILVLVAAGQPWVHAEVDLPSPLPSARYTLSGRDVAPEPGALGLAGLAGLAGVVATRRTVRAVVGVLLALIGAAIVVFSVFGTGHDRALSDLAAQTPFGGEGSAATVTVTAWWVVSLVGGILLFAAGLLTAARGRGWPGMPGRYDRPGATRATVAEQHHEPSTMWDSLDRGGDPTVDGDAERDGTTGKGS